MAEFKKLVLTYPLAEEIKPARASILQCEERLAQHAVLIGEHYVRVKAYPAAIDRLTEILTEYPSFSGMERVYYGLGVAYIGWKKPEQAVPYLTKLVTDYPKSQAGQEGTGVAGRGQDGQARAGRSARQAAGQEIGGPMRASRWLAIPALCLAAAGALTAQATGPAAGSGIKVSFQVEVFSRTLTWDEGTRSSRLFNPQALVSFDYQVAPGFDLGLVAGYSLSNWNGLVFRNLPFSIDYQAGSINGLVIGAGLRKSFFVSGFWEMDAEARFTAHLGQASSFPIPGLAVTARPTSRGPG